jgi:hypothetical protein
LTPQFLKSAGKKTIKGIGIKKCRDGREDKLKWVGQEELEYRTDVREKREVKVRVKKEKGELYKCQLNIIEELILAHRRS